MANSSQPSAPVASATASAAAASATTSISPAASVAGVVNRAMAAGLEGQEGRQASGVPPTPLPQRNTLSASGMGSGVGSAGSVTMTGRILAAASAKLPGAQPQWQQPVVTTAGVSHEPAPPPPPLGEVGEGSAGGGSSTRVIAVQWDEWDADELRGSDRGEVSELRARRSCRSVSVHGGGDEAEALSDGSSEPDRLDGLIDPDVREPRTSSITFKAIGNLGGMDLRDQADEVSPRVAHAVCSSKSQAPPVSSRCLLLNTHL